MAVLEVNNTVQSQIMDLKTSRPGVTRKEEIKTGYKNIYDYSSYLQGKYSFMNTGVTSMQGVPVTVSVSPAFLEKCNKDPEKAAYLEENLSAIPGCIKSAVEYTKTMPGNPVMLYERVEFDANGNITMISGCTNDPDGKIAKQNAKRKLQEQKVAKEKIEEKRAKKKELEEQRIKNMQGEMQADDESDYSLKIVGNNIREMTDSWINSEIVIDNLNGQVVGFDVKG